jgi:Mrp family chromosome partitioning ATPase
MINVEPVSTRSLPLNFGPLRGFNGHARIEGDCGDTMEFWMEVDDGIVRRASFTTDGCQTSIACGSMAARLAEGRALRDLKRSRPLEVLEALGQGDNAEAHPCADLALRTLARAAADYEEAVRPRRDPSQCPDDADCGRCGETCEHPKPQAQAAPLSQEGPASIRKRLLVLSGKGGVGKSTVAVNLAMGFAFQGLRTGLLDVDIHGPSVPKLLGLEKQTLQSEGGEILPVEVGGLKVMSMGFILKAGEPAIWRGPMKAGAISQLIRQVQWQDLDVLVVDCPPGTGDEHLALVQTLGRVDGAVIVTTPQDLACLDARKAITFCRTLQVPVLGLVENMSGFTCPSCGTTTPIFRVGGGRRLAEELGIPFLGALPIDPEVGQTGDEGQPQLYRELGFGARKAFQPVLRSLLRTLKEEAHG